MTKINHKLSNKTTYVFGCLALVVSSNLFAKNHNPINYHGGQVKQAKVIQVTPTYRQVTIQTPTEHCWIETSVQPSRHHKYRNEHRNNHYTSHSSHNNYYNGTQDSAAPLIGAVIGGVIGNQFGKGNGKPIATIAGAMIGGAVAHEKSKSDFLNNSQYRTHYNDRPVNHRKHHTKVVKKQVCKTSHTPVKTINELTGYDVSYRYKGETYYTHTQNHPGDFINVSVNVTPLD